MSNRSTLFVLTSFFVSWLIYGATIESVHASEQNLRPETLISEYQLGVRAVLTRMDQVGLSQLGRLPTGRFLTTQLLRDRLHEVEFIVLSDFTKPRGATRTSAFYDPKTKKVYLNGSIAQNQDVLPALALHEVLGALGYGDQNYEISTAAWIFWTMLNPGETLVNSLRVKKLKEAIATALGNQSPNAKNARSADPNMILALGGGGGNAVGGGGDLEGLQFKIALITALTNDTRFEHPENLYFHGLTLKVEVTNDPEVQEIEFSPQRILVPRNRSSILSGTATQVQFLGDVAIDEIIEFLSRTHVERKRGLK